MSAALSSSPPARAPAAEGQVLPARGSALGRAAIYPLINQAFVLISVTALQF